MRGAAIPANAAPASPVRLPARLDTLGALAFAAELRGLPDTIDATDAEEVGLVALQLLAAARAGRRFVLANGSPGLVQAIGDAGLSRLLLDAPDPRPPGRHLRVRFGEEALRFGGEPLALLGALRAGGATIRAVLPEAHAPAILAEPDRLLIAFDIWPADADAARAALEAEAGIAFAWREADAEEAPPDPPAAAPAIAEPPPLVPVAQEKLDRVIELADALVSANAALVGRLQAHRTGLASEIADVERTAAALQDGVVRLGTSRLDMLLAQALEGVAVAVLAGGGMEVERALFARIAPALAEVLAPRAEIAAREEGGFLSLRVAPAATPRTWLPLVEAARRVGGWAEPREDGRTLDARLPRSLSLFEVLVLDVGGHPYAVPVSHMVEALRPTPAMLGRIGGRAVLRYRERYVPLCAIGDRFVLDGWERDPARAVLVVAHAGAGMIALQADAIVDQRQIALKPLGGGLALPEGLAGAAVIGADRIALLLDLAAFARPIGPGLA